MPTTPPTAPPGLGKKAKRLWRETVRTYDLAPHELLILESACREWDMVERLDEAMRKQRLVVDGSQGQPVANELLQELRMHRSEYVKQLKALALPEEDSSSPAEVRSLKATRAARARWDKPPSRRRGAS